MTKRPAFVLAILGGVGLLAAVVLTLAPAPDASSATVAANVAFAELPDGRGGTNVEAIVYTEQMGFDKERSLAAFEDTVYPLLNTYCSGCHSTERTDASATQAPIHSDLDAKLAHEYALTRVNFREPENSRLVVRMGIERHNCFRGSCETAAATMLDAVTAWRDAVADMIPEVPRGVAADTKITEEQVLAWIDADEATVPDAEREFIKYASFHQLHNAGVSAQNLNHARVGLSKALNSTARWAPRIVNPVDVNGKGIVYRFDLRDYWGHTLIDTSAPDFALFYGGSDDDLAFAEAKVDLSGKSIKYASLAEMVHKLKPEVTRDDKFARLVWARILKGNAEGAAEGKSLPPNVAGFVGTKEIGPHGQEYIRPENLVYAEAGQLTYTLTRPDVYNAIMAIPGYSYHLEEELGVDKSAGMDSYDYMLTYEAITVDLSYVATLPLGKYSFDTKGTVGRYTGQDGPQQSAEEVIFSLPNGLQGYVLFGAWNQRRVDAFTNIVRDPRILRHVSGDATLDNLTGFGRDAGISDARLNTASSCIGCHVDGMNRINNDLRDWLDEENSARLPKGEFGVDSWIKDPATVQRVRDLYPPSSEMRGTIENDRRQFLGAMAQIKQEMVLGVDKNVYVEPAIWTIEWARNFYDYPVTRSN